jgi:multiple antibiotic resistance protein
MTAFRGISPRERSYRPHARGGEKSAPGSRCALPQRGPARRQPLLSGADQGILTGSAKSTLAWRIAMNSFFLLIGSYFVGTYVLAFFGISLPVVQVGGGLIVIATGWTLLKQRDDEKHDVHRTVQPQDTFHQAFYPLTMPLTVGPGSISVAITLGANAAHHHPFHVLTILAALIGLVLIAISIFLCYGFADRLARMLGATGMTVITQLSSFFLVVSVCRLLGTGSKHCWSR